MYVTLIYAQPIRPTFLVITVTDILELKQNTFASITNIHIYYAKPQKKAIHKKTKYHKKTLPEQKSSQNQNHDTRPAQYTT